jgi:hypothetical protein
VSASLTLVTQIRATVRRTSPLKLSPLLRHAIRTATASAPPNSPPLLLPSSIPACCCHDLFRCRARVSWRVGDGRNRVFFCDDHYEEMIQAHDAFSFESERWRS